MDRSLWLLLGLRVRAFLRQAGRQLRTLKGALFALVGSLCFLPILLASFFASVFTTRSHDESIRRFGPAALLAYCVLNLLFSSGERAITFSPSEVNLLFAGPFRRRQLLIFKVILSVGASVLSSVFMTLLVRHHAGGTLAAFVALALAFEFLYLFSLTIGLATSTVAALSLDRRRRFVIVALGILLAAVLLSSGREALTLPPRERLAQLERSPVAGAVLAPFRPFVLAFTAGRPSELALWSGVAAAIDAALVALVLAMDASYYEAAEAAGARIYERIRKARRGNLWAPPTRARHRVPMLPWWGGVGPNLWRHVVSAVRRPGQLILLFLVTLSPMVIFRGLAAFEDRPLAPERVVPAAIGMMVYLVLFASTLISFDFRVDLDRIEEIKTLPIPPRRLVLGQVMTTAIVMTLVEWLALASLRVTIWIDPLALGGTAALVVPFNLLVVEIDNLFFLWYPVRVAGGPSIDFATLGRQMLFMMAKFTAILLVGGAAAGVGAAAFFLLGRSWPAALAAGWLAAAAAAWAMLPLLALAFTQFDVARDTPA